MDFPPVNFINNLRYMGLGMAAIFVIIGVIIAVTVILNKVFAEK